MRSTNAKRRGASAGAPGRALLLASLAVAGLIGFTGFVPAGERAAGARVSEPFRAEHADIRVHLGHIQEAVGQMRAAAPEDQKKSMLFVSGFLKEHILAHAAWEEKVLYPAVDRLAKSGKDPFTATMRHEHGIVGRWVGELAAEAAKETPDVEAFARRADNVLGLLWAHFEEEEEVLLLLIDSRMTPQQFEREILSKMEKHG